MKEMTKSAKTVEQAVELAIKELNVTKDQIEYEVLEEPKKGILGFIGAREAHIKVKVKPNPVQMAKEYLENIIKSMGVEVTIHEQSTDRFIEFQLEGDDLALLIGKRGQTLNALQYLSNLVANRYSEHKIRVLIDAEGYRSRRKESLEKLAGRLAEKAIYTKKSVKLEPMPSYERKIIHTVLQDKEKVNTTSHGEEPHRYVVISPKS